MRFIKNTGWEDNSFGTIEGKTSSEVFFALTQIYKIDTLFTVQPWPEIS
jgi:hypothetical protein